MLSHPQALYRAAGLTLSLGMAGLTSCTKSENRPAEAGLARDTVVAIPAAPEVPSTISLADIAGKWKMRSTDASGGNPVEAELLATTDSQWTVTGPNGKAYKERVLAVAGDSIVTEGGPFASFLPKLKGVQVTTHSVMRLRDGKLVDTYEARYATQHGDSVVQRHSEGTRVR